MKLKNILRKIQVQNPVRLIADALNIEAKDVYQRIDCDLNSEELISIKRALLGVPAGRILKEKIFYDLPFKVHCSVFEPRNDTEQLIHYIQNNLSPKSILDVCTGTGAILLTLLRLFPDAYGVGTDISSYAIENAIVNANLLGVADRCSIIQTNFTEKIQEGFDLVISNPPYVIGDIDDSAKFDPPISLYKPCANPYNVIIQSAKINPGGYIIFESPTYITFDYGHLQLIKCEKIAEMVNMIVLQNSIKTDISDMQK